MAQSDSEHPFIKPDRTSYTPLDFVNLREQKSLEVVPKFQRRPVWTTPAKAYFIDTLIRGLPVPPIYLRVAQSPDRKRTVRQVIDGQQRISSVLDYMDGKFALTKALDEDYAGKEFGELRLEQQDAITQYSFSCEVFHGISDAMVLEIFARMNTFSVQLNAQELRNGRYFGRFKQCAYDLAYEHVEFWRRNRVFTERAIARMSEVELTSELLIMELHGMQDKKKSINSYYAKYDDVFREQKRAQERFRATMDSVSDSVGEVLAASAFRRPPLFYSLFGVVYHRRFGIPRLDLATPKKTLSRDERRSLRDAVQRLSDILRLAREGEPVPDRHSAFVTASQRQTDNIQPRNIRFRTLYRAAF